MNIFKMNINTLGNNFRSINLSFKSCLPNDEAFGPQKLSLLKKDEINPHL